MSENMDIFDEVEELVKEDAAKIFSPQVIDHFRNPRNYGQMENADGYTYMSGMCGDTIGIYVGLTEGKIERISFVTDGCGATTACSSALTCMAKGLEVSKAMKLTGPDLIAYLGGLPIENTHCADLAVNTLKGALEKTS